MGMILAALLPKSRSTKLEAKDEINSRLSGDEEDPRPKLRQQNIVVMKSMPPGDKADHAD
jgi:hypothetical protein